jgi:oxygen-dependent protoporphyrinogen oxidase
MRKRVIVIGGGISGLAVARALKQQSITSGAPLDITVLEAEPLPGGKIRTAREGGWTVERGPNGFLDSAPRTRELAVEVGLEDGILKASDAATERSLYCRGALRSLPTSPLSFFGSDLLSLRGRARMLLEPFTRRPRDPGRDESVASFARRHLGDEAAHTLVSSMVLGVFGGDSEKLSLRSAFPKMHEMERDHGSLVRAMVSKMRARRKARRRGDAESTRPGGPAGPAGVLTSFRGGMSDLVEALARDLGEDLRCGSKVVSLRREGHQAVSEGWELPLWKVATAGGEPELEAEAVILAGEAFSTASLVETLDRRAARELRAIPYAPIVVVGLGYERSRVPGGGQGFGFLVPRGHGLRILGCLYDSGIFPGRAPEGRVLLRAMVGGAVDPGALELDDEAIVQLVREDLRMGMGISAPPEKVFVSRWPAGIPQYVVGHRERLDRIHDLLFRSPGIFLGGNAYRGVALNSCVTEADRLARDVLGFLGG